MALPLPGIPEPEFPTDWNGDPVEAAIGRPKREYTPPIQPPPPGIIGVPQATSPLEPVETVPETQPASSGAPAQTPKTVPYSTMERDVPSVTTVVRSPRKQRAPKSVKSAGRPPRKKAQGRYRIFVEWGVSQERDGEKRILQVLVPNAVDEFRSRVDADRCARETAAQQPGKFVEVHRVLSRFTVQEVKTVRLIKS